MAMMTRFFLLAVMAVFSPFSYAIDIDHGVFDTANQAEAACESAYGTNCDSTTLGTVAMDTYCEGQNGSLFEYPESGVGWHRYYSCSQGCGGLGLDTDPITGECIQPNPCLDLQGQPSSPYGHVPLTEFTNIGCDNGCTTTFSGAGPSWFIENGKLTGYMEGEYLYWGDTCTAGTQPATGPAPVESCGPGQTPGTINGEFVCVDENGPTEPDPPTQEEQDKEDEILQQQEPPRITQTDRSENTVDNGDGTTTTTETITETFADGSTRTTTNTTTTNADGSTTTTSGTTTTGGDAEEQEKKEEEEENGNFTDSGCKVAPRCTGDVLQCAIARQAWETKCNLEIEPSDVASASEIDNAVNPTGTGLSLEETFSPDNPDNQIDIGDYITFPTPSAGACPADYSATVLGNAVTFSWDFVCQFGSLVRPVMIAIAWLISGLLLYRGLVRDI